ncbi:MAG: DUF6279 family lipoprotein [Gammaproteobacteria bacterium]|nr:DUF6279 family lipoprotein [Gammaproteobacteria bacterium]
MRKIFLVMITAFMLSACSMKTIYNQLDWIAADYLGNFVDLSEAQEEQLHKHLAATLKWHRDTQLQTYADWLQKVKKDVQSGLTKKKVVQGTQEMQDAWNRLMIRFADDMAGVLPGLSKEQQQELFDGFKSKNEEYKEERVEISKEEQLEKTTERLTDGLKNWIGEVHPDQEKLVAAAAKKLKPLASESLQTRQRWQAKLKSIIENHKNKKSTRNALRSLFAKPEILRSENYKNLLAHNKNVIEELIVSIAKTLTFEQEHYYYSRLDYWSDFFTDLAMEGKAG